jgi:SNF2 family DNA or RNA helicase
MTLNPTWPGVTYARHQIEGIEWMLNLEENGYEVPGTDTVIRGGILGDEMGLGKTIQAIAVIVNGKGKNTLIVTPLAVRQQWEEAVLKCKVNLFTAEKTGFVRHGPIRPLAKSIYLGHYDKLVSSLELFQSVKWDRIILDEAHRIRNTKTVTGTSVLKLKAHYKWALTATPIVNSLDDVVAYLKFVGFKGLGSGWSQSYKAWISHIYMARTLDEGEAPVGLTMPPNSTSETLHLDFTNEEEEEVYRGILDNLEAKWRSSQALNGRAYQLQKFAMLLRLRQVSVNPQIYIRARQKELFGWTGPEFHLPSRKFDEISHLLRQGYEDGEPNRWIIFCQFHDEMVLLSEFLEAFPFVGSVLQYHGGMGANERQDAIEQSKVLSTDGKQDVFLIQLQAGGTGLNLQHYNRIIFISPWWTSALLEQAKGRAIRIGQKDVVKVYWLKLKAEEDRFSIDNFMMEKVDSKKVMADEFLSWAHNKKNN